jgi:hypothetical protein
VRAVVWEEREERFWLGRVDVEVRFGRVEEEDVRRDEGWDGGGDGDEKAKPESWRDIFSLLSFGEDGVVFGDEGVIVDVRLGDEIRGCGGGDGGSGVGIERADWVYGVLSGLSSIWA